MNKMSNVLNGLSGGVSVLDIFKIWHGLSKRWQLNNAGGITFGETNVLISDFLNIGSVASSNVVDQSDSGNRDIQRLNTVSYYLAIGSGLFGTMGSFSFLFSPEGAFRTAKSAPLGSFRKYANKTSVFSFLFNSASFGISAAVMLDKNLSDNTVNMLNIVSSGLNFIGGTLFLFQAASEMKEVISGQQALGRTQAIFSTEETLPVKRRTSLVNACCGGAGDPELDRPQISDIEKPPPVKFNDNLSTDISITDEID